MVEQDPITCEIKTHQNHYVKALKPIPMASVPRAHDNEPAAVYLVGLFMSLLGAVGWTTGGRTDHCVYVSALQRHLKAPLNIHVRMLNTLVAYLKSHPTTMVFRCLRQPLMITTAADSAYRRDTKDGVQDGLAMKGAIFALVSKQLDGGPGGELNLIDWFSRKQRHVTTNTWSSEAFAVTSAADFLMIVGSMFHEVDRGVQTSAEVLMKLREDGGYSLPLSVCTDGMSLLTAVQNVVAKVPTEASTLHHVQWLQQLLRRRVLHALYWVDTRDMIADGMTKGSVPRQALRTLQEKGAWRLQH